MSWDGVEVQAAPPLTTDPQINQTVQAQGPDLHSMSEGPMNSFIALRFEGILAGTDPAGAGICQSTALSASRMPSPYRPLSSVVPSQVAFQSGGRPSSV